jgi:hypothetical protein
MGTTTTPWGAEGRALMERRKREMREMREIRAWLTAHAVHSELVKRMRADWRRRDHTLDPDT